METMQIRLIPKQLWYIDAEVKRLKDEGYSWHYANRCEVIRRLIEKGLNRGCDAK